MASQAHLDTLALAFLVFLDTVANLVIVACLVCPVFLVFLVIVDPVFLATVAIAVTQAHRVFLVSLGTVVFQDIVVSLVFLVLVGILVLE